MTIRKSVLALALSASLLLASCTETDAVPVKHSVALSVSWWGRDVRHSYTISALNEFSKLNPDIELSTEFAEFDPFLKQMDVEFATHHECDVMMINYDWLFRYSPDGTGFYDLGQLADEIDLSTFTAEQLSYGIVDGKLNAISNALNCETCYYNADLYKRYGLGLPSSWDDLFKAAELMRGDGIYPIELNRKASWMAAIAHEEQRTGIRCFDDNNKLGFTAENFANVVSFYRDLVEKNVTKYMNEIGTQDFTRGISAGAMVWISDAGYFCEPAIKSGHKIEVGDYLRIPGSEILGWYAKPTSMYCIRRDTKSPKEAAKLVDFLINSEEMALLQGTEKGIPMSKSMLEVLESNDLLHGIQFDSNKKLLSTIEIKRVSPYLENIGLVEAFERSARAVLYEGEDPESEGRMLYDIAKDLKLEP